MALINRLLGMDFDNREPMMRDKDGNAIMLKVTGDIDEIGGIDYADTPNHEDYVHDGTPHRNPVVRERGGFLGLFRRQERYYPLTTSPDGREADLEAIRRQAEATAMRKGQKIEIVSVNRRIERQAERVEDQTQRDRGFFNRLFGI